MDLIDERGNKKGNVAHTRIPDYIVLVLSIAEFSSGSGRKRKMPSFVYEGRVIAIDAALRAARDKVARQARHRNSSFGFRLA